jgi:ribonuclease Z
MELLFLGTGAGMPAKSRNVTSIALKMLDERNEVWLFDCGEGTQHQILHTTLRPRKISKIFITHLHGDHIFGLPGFLSSRSFQTSEEVTPLDIYGPVGIKQYVQTSLKISGARLSYPVNYHEFDKENLGLIFKDDKTSVYAEELSHTIFSVGFRVVEADRPGELDAQALKEAGVPFGPLFGKIKAGQDVTLEDGTHIKASDYIGQDKAGKIVTILGDTRKTDASIRLAAGADVLVHEATYEAKESKVAWNHGHATTKQAAEVAKAANAKRLLATHISARYVGGAVQQLASELKAVFPNAYVAKDFYEEEV